MSLLALLGAMTGDALAQSYYYYQEVPGRYRAAPPRYEDPRYVQPPAVRRPPPRQTRQQPRPRRVEAPPPQPEPQQQGFQIPILGFIFSRIGAALSSSQPQYQYQQPDMAPTRPRADAAPRAAPRRAVQPRMHVAVMGDSLAENLAQGLTDALADRPEVALIRKLRPGTGFLKSGANWEGTAREILANEKPVNAIVVMLGPTDDPVPPDAKAETEAAPDRPRAAWTDVYAARVDDLLVQLRQKNIPLIWVGLPPVRDAATSADHAFVNDLVRERVRAFGGIFVDPWEGFVDEDARFVASGPTIEGRSARLRSADGVHFTRAGARKLAHYVEVELRPILAPGDDDAAAAAAAIATAPVAPGTSRIILLGSPPRAPGAMLAGGPTVEQAVAPAAPAADTEIAERVLVRGEPAKTRAGRADDYSWPTASN